MEGSLYILVPVILVVFWILNCIKIFNEDQAGIIKALYCQKAGEIASVNAPASAD